MRIASLLRMRDFLRIERWVAASGSRPPRNDELRFRSVTRQAKRVQPTSRRKKETGEARKRDCAPAPSRGSKSFECQNGVRVDDVSNRLHLLADEMSDIDTII